MNDLSRRQLLRRSTCGFGGMALAGLLVLGGITIVRAGEPGLLVLMHDRGRVEAPPILSAPDFGQLRSSNVDRLHSTNRPRPF